MKFRKSTKAGQSEENPKSRSLISRMTGFLKPSSRTPSRSASTLTSIGSAADQGNEPHSDHEAAATSDGVRHIAVTFNGPNAYPGHDAPLSQAYSIPPRDLITPTSSGQPQGLSNTRVEIPGDPTSSTASAASVIKDYAAITWRLTQTLLKRLPDVTDGNPVKAAFGIAKLILEIKDGVVDNLDAVERRVVSTAAQLDVVGKELSKWKPARAEDEQPMNRFKNALREELKKLYQLQDESIIRKVVDQEDEKKRIAEIFERVNEARVQFELAIGIRVFKSLYEMEGEFRKSLLKELKPSKIADHKYYLEGDEGKLLRRTACTPGTRVRLLDNIINWANNSSSDGPSVYWLFGPAGSGKSTIAYTIACRFEFAGDIDGTAILGGNFFCSRQFEETKQAKRIIRTIACHLALVCKPFADALSRSGAFDSIDHDTKSQIQHLLVKPWQVSEADRMADPSSPPHYLVIIDALDEIDGKGGLNFLRDLFDVFNQSELRGLKLFATSRPDPDLVKEVDSFWEKELCRLQDVEKEEVRHDIEAYLAAELPHFENSEEIDAVVESADGLFIYAATIVRYLEGYETSEQAELLLSVTDSSALKRPGEEAPLLDKLYRQILVHAFDDLNEVIRRRRLHILHTFLCTTERTSEGAVAHLLCASNRTDSYIQGAAAVVKGLHAVLYTEKGRVLSYHKSFSDFLFSQNRSQEFWCDQAIQNQLLTESCFRTMNANSGLKFNIADIPSSYILDRDNSELGDRVKQNIHDALRYSCCNWNKHLCFTAASTSSDPWCRLLSEFLQLRALFWIEAMNLLQLQGECDPTLRSVANWVRETDAVLAGKLTEAANFALYFSGSPTTSSTPHLYISSLATWPGGSEPCVGWKALFPHVPAFRSALQGVSATLMSINLEAAVKSVAYSRDGSRIASGSVDKLVRVWNASTGELLNVLDGHTGIINSVAFSTDGSRIVSGSHDGSVRVWNALTGDLLNVLRVNGHTDFVKSVAFSRDGSRIASGSVDKSMRIWNALTGELLNVLDSHAGWVNSMAFSTDGSWIVSGSYNGSVRVWDGSTGELLSVLDGDTNLINSVAFSTDDSRIISGSREVRVWNSSTGELLHVLDGHTGSVNSVTFSSDGSRIVSGSNDRSVRVWNASTGELLNVLDGHTDLINSVAFSTDGSRIVSGSDDSSVRVWNASTGELLKLLDSHTQFVHSVALSTDGSRITSGSHDGLLRVWNALTGKLLNVLDGHTKSVSSVTFSSDGSRIVSGSYDRSVRVWNAWTGELLTVLDGHAGMITSVTISTDGSRIVSGSNDKSVRVWSASTGELLNVLDGHTSWVNSVAFSRDGSRIASGSVDKSMRIWNALTGELLNVLDGHTGWVNSVAFSIDDSRIVSGSNDRSLRVWNALTGELINVLDGHSDFVNSVAFSTDSSRIISGSRDKSLRVWNASTGELLKVLDGHTSRVRSVALSTDGSRIVSGSSDKSVRVWDTTMMPRYLRERRGRTYTGWLLSPTGEERLMFVPIHAKLPDSANTLTIPPSASSSVDFTGAALGLEWQNCYSP